MKIAFNEYYDERIVYIINHIKNAVPKYKVSWKDEEVYKFKYIPSTFPDYTAFVYKKKPKDWHLYNSKEKKQFDYYYQWNTRNVLGTLRKALTHKRLTYLQGNFIEQMFIYFRDYEYEMNYIHSTDIFEKESIPF